jgi:hypothetical protein
MFQPPERFGLIETGVYRSAFPSPENFGHLRLLRLRTVVNLSQEALTRAATSFLMSDQGILLVDVGLQVWTHAKCESISDELIKEAMRYVLDPSYHPLLIVSASGSHQVGALVGCLRRLQQWTLSSALDEYRAYSAPSARLSVEQFIELWDCDLLTLPSSLPLWFESQQQLLDADRERWRRERGAADPAPPDAEEGGASVGSGSAALVASGGGEYFATAGPLMEEGTVTSTIDRGGDIED